MKNPWEDIRLNDYEKHMSLVVGLLFLLVMIHPIMTFFGIDGQTYIDLIIE